MGSRPKLVYLSITVTLIGGSARDPGKRWNYEGHQYPTHYFDRNAGIVLVCCVDDPTAKYEIDAAESKIA